MTNEQHADAILRDAETSLANYIMPGTRAAILAAVQAVRDDECARVVDWLRTNDCVIAGEIERGEHLTKG